MTCDWNVIEDTPQNKQPKEISVIDNTTCYLLLILYYVLSANRLKFWKRCNKCYLLFALILSSYISKNESKVIVHLICIQRKLNGKKANAWKWQMLSHEKVLIIIGCSVVHSLMIVTIMPAYYIQMRDCLVAMNESNSFKEITQQKKKKKQNKANGQQNNKNQNAINFPCIISLR